MAENIPNILNRLIFRQLQDAKQTQAGRKQQRNAYPGSTS